MADIFISYSRESEPQARRVVSELVRAGYDVWWDQDLLPHTTFSQVTEDRLRSAKAVLVLWSEPGVQSQWVRAEADVGRTAGTLIQARLDGALPPLPFNQVQATSLADWTGDPQHPGWRKVLASVEHLTGKALRASTPPPDSRPGTARRRTTLLALAAAGLLIAIASGAWWLLRNASVDAPGTPRVTVRAFEVIAGSPDFVPIAARLTDTVTGILNENVVPTLADDATREADLTVGGAVSREAGLVHVRVVLVDPRSKFTLWSAQLERPIEQEAALRDAVAVAAGNAVTDALRTFRGGQKLDPQTMALFIKGSEATQLQQALAPGQNLRAFEQVVARAPKFGEGHAMVATTLMAGATGEARGTLLARIRSEAQTAIRLSPSTSGSAYDALFGVARAEAPADLAGAEDILLAGLRADPDFPFLNMRECDVLTAVGRLAEGLRYCERGIALRPLAAPVAHRHARALNAVGRPELAAQAIAKAFRFHPTHPIVRRVRFDLPALTGSAPAALAILRDPDQRPLNLREAEIAALEAFLHARETGATADQMRALQLLRGSGGDGRYVVLAAAAFGRIDEAFAGLEDPRLDVRTVLPMLFEPVTAPLRRDPRFWRIAARTGLITYWRKRGVWPDFCADPTLPYDCKREAAKYPAAG